MSDGGSLINIGELSKPATVLIEKISDAIGGIFRPYQIRRVAQAEAEAERIEAVTQIEVSELQRRAVQRFVAEEAKKQINMESITQEAIPHIKDDAKSEDVDDDWISHFFDKCRLISDDEMQKLWSAVLAGEANSPGQYSKRTVTLLSSLDKEDAGLFQKLCSFGWMIGNVVPLIYDHQADIYTQAGITFTALQHLDAAGLVSFQSIGGFKRQGLPQRVAVFYYGTQVIIEFPKPENNEIELGTVMLTQAGQQLAPICASASQEGFLDYVRNRWREKGWIVDGEKTE